MALSYNRTYVENQSTGKALEGVVVRVYKNNVLQSVFADESSTPLPTVITGADGSAFYYVNGDGTYEEEYVYNGDILDRVTVTIFNPANYASGANVDTILGATAATGHFGTFTGATIPDNVAAKPALQALETATELRPTSATLAAITGAGLVGADYGGTGATATNMLNILRGGPAVLVKAGFGATGDGATNDTTAFTNATARAQALGVDLYVAKGTFRVGNWVVARGSGALNIILAPDAIMKLPDSGGGANAAILTINENYVNVTGGTWDGNSSVLNTGEQYCIKVFSGAVGQQVTGVTIKPTKVQNVFGGGIFVLGANDTHVIGGYYTGTTINCVVMVSGNSATSGFDTVLSNCSIRDARADRSAIGIAAEQGCFRITSNGTFATSLNANNCLISNCIATMAETDAQYNGNIPIEIWAKGRGNKIVNCTSYGGFIGISMAKEQTGCEIVNCTSIGAKSIGQELAAVSSGKIVNPTVIATTGNGATGVGVSLDFQNYTSYSTIPSDLSCIGGTITGVITYGVQAIAPSLPSANAYQGRKIRIISPNITLNAASAIGVVVQNIEDFEVDCIVDGQSLAGTVGVRSDGSRWGKITVKSARIASQNIQIGRVANATIQKISMVIESLDGTGSIISFVGASGTWGTGFPALMEGVEPYGVRSAKFSELSPSGYGSSVWTGGVYTGTPEGVVDAAIGSMLQRSNGGAATSIYIKETGSGNTGWVGK